MADEEEDEMLSEFLSWCDTNGLILSKKVNVGLRGSCHRYGMTATDDIEKGECLFEIPRSLLLQPKTSSISEILENLTDKGQFASERGSGWAPLLLALMYEYTNPASHWKPYLNLVPDITILDQPIFWGEDEREKELKGTGIEEDVEGDIQRIEEEYNTIVLPFIKNHQHHFSESCHTIDLYKHMAAFVMAYSFTEQSANDDSNHDNDAAATAPAMVPMADILNHISNNNAHLEFGTETMTMVATQDICKGQEIFNTYGKLANCHLLQSYGFVEDELPNPYDMVDIPISAFYEVMKANQPSKAAKLLNAKFEFMEEMGVASEDDMFLFGREGCSHFGPDLYATLRILHLTEGQFKQLLEDQVRKQRSEEFNDIDHVLDQQDEEAKMETSWRILEQVFKAEKRKERKKRTLYEQKSEGKNKKIKIVHNNKEFEDEVILENNPSSKACNDIVIPGLNGCFETGNATSQPNKGEVDPSADRTVSSPGVDGNLTRAKTKDVPRNDKKDFVKGDETWDKEKAENNKASVSDSGECDSDEEYGNDIDDNSDDGDDNEDVDDFVDGDDNGDDDGHDDDGEEEEEEEEEKEESEQPLTYDLLSEWPVEWRRTLKSVAKLCLTQQYGDDKMDQDTAEDSKLTKRQLFVLRIKRGQRSIFQRICELQVENN